MKRDGRANMEKILPKHKNEYRRSYDLVIPLICDSGRSCDRSWFQRDSGEEDQHQEIENNAYKDDRHHGARTNLHKRLTDQPRQNHTTYARADVRKIGRQIANVHVEAWQESRLKPVAAIRGHFMLSGT